MTWSDVSADDAKHLIEELETGWHQPDGLSPGATPVVVDYPDFAISADAVGGNNKVFKISARFDYETSELSLVVGTFCEFNEEELSEALLLAGADS